MKEHGIPTTFAAMAIDKELVFPINQSHLLVSKGTEYFTEPPSNPERQFQLFLLFIYFLIVTFYCEKCPLHMHWVREGQHLSSWKDRHFISF